MPINQADPPSKVGLITGDPYSFVNTVKYCHHYPDFMCYERTGNGWTDGDEYFWTIVSCTDASGLGAVHVRFPNFADSEAGNNINGIYHSRQWPFVFGVTVILFSATPSLRFSPDDTSLYKHTVPWDYLDRGLYVDFHGPVSQCHVFSMRRQVFWKGQPPPYSDAPVPTGHDEL